MTRYSVWMDGQGLQDIDQTVIVMDIQEQQPQSQIITADWASRRDGTRFVRHMIQAISVVVRFQVREYDVTRRKMIVSDIAAWANGGGWLTINDRPGQRLRVRCTATPRVSSALRWTDTLSVTFTAYEWPYWEDERETSAAVSGSGDSRLNMLVPGNGAYAYLSGELKFNGIGKIEITSVNTRFELHNITNGVSWGYTDGILYMTSGGESVLSHRTPDSSDDLIVIPGQKNVIDIVSTVPVSGRVYTRGCYL